ncbi:MAG: CapA family protein [Candidatus Omnitrophica bacterium]|nr:CapA family protein [Candidatus Omnitrophota bacterium]
MIYFTGDLFLGNDKISISKDIQDMFNNADYIISNLEGVLENKFFPERKDKCSVLTFSLNSFNNYLPKIKGKIIFTLGNNHIHDLGTEGLLSTKKLLSKHSKINYFGADTYKNVINPNIFNLCRKKVAFLCVSTEEPEVTAKCAKENYQGILSYNDSRIKNIIKQAKKKVDHFVIISHWGREYIDYPALKLRHKAYNWIDAGTDLVIGHHPHVIQGKEEYEGKWIYYSLGNYIFPDRYTKKGVKKAWSKDNCRSVILAIDFSDKILIKETGVIYNKIKNELQLDEKSFNIFNSKSIPLDRKNVTTRKYFTIWENNYITCLHSRKRLNIIQKYFPEHKKYSRAWFFLKRLLNKTKNTRNKMIKNINIFKHG